MCVLGGLFVYLWGGLLFLSLLCFRVIFVVTCVALLLTLCVKI